MEKSLVSTKIRYNKDFKETNLSKYQERIKFKEYIKCGKIWKDYKEMLEAIMENYSNNNIFRDNFEKLIDEVINKNKIDEEELKEIGLIFDGIEKLRIKFDVEEKRSVIIEIKEGVIDYCAIEKNKMVEIMNSLVSKYKDNKHSTKYKITEQANGIYNINMLLDNVKIKINKINDNSSIKNDKIKIYVDGIYIIIEWNNETEEIYDFS